MRRLRTAALTIAVVMIGGGADLVSAQTNTTPAPAAFVHAVRSVCGPNVQGRLPFGLDNADLNTAHVVLVDPSEDPATLAAFHDWADRAADYGFVPSDSGRINLGVDPERVWCRVAALDVTAGEVAAMRQGLADLSDWSETGVVDAETTQFLATLEDEVVFVRVTVPATGSAWGPHAGLIVTVMNPAAQE